MDALLLVIRHQLRTRVVGVQLDLVDGRNGLAGGVAEEFLEVLNTEVGYTDVADFAGGGKLLHFLPGVWLGEAKCKTKGGDEK